MRTIKFGTVKARRVDVLAMMLLGLLIVSGAALAQGDPTSNVNLIGMTPDPADIPDIGYRQQNEPACAIRPGDSACIICAYNDYRGVDFPLDAPIGDSWQGVSQSCDAGNTWRSRLAPGFPGDLDAENIPAEFAADPRLVAIPGMAIFNFIAGYRDSNVGVLAIQHWLEVNKEDADHYEPGYVTWFADTGTSGRFLDKPDILGVLDPTGPQSTIELVTEMENPELGDNGFITRSFPTGKLYVGFAVFTGSQSVKVLVKTSDDWGRTFRNRALKLSEDQNEVSGVSLTEIGGNKVLAVWRRKGDNNDLDSIMYSVISNGGKKATKGKVLADICTFDQPTLAGETFDLGGAAPDGPFVAFRTNDFPWSATDGDNLFVFYSERQRNQDGSCNILGRPRIMMNYSVNAGQGWLPQLPEQPITLDDPNNPPPAGSFQFMPTAFGANGKIQVAWYDTRREIFGGAGTVWPFVTDYDVGDALFVQRAVDVFTTSVTLNNGVLDIPPPVQVSQYSAQLAERGGNLFYFDTEASLANKKLFGKGTASFLGDYIAVAARGFRKTANGKWESNASEGPVGQRREDFFAAWADNRDVVGEVTGLTDPSTYGFEADAGVGSLESQETASKMLADSQSPPRTGPPRDTLKTAEGLEGDDNIVACTPETERTRDANIYGSLIKDQERLFAPTPRKPLSGLKRAFPVSLTNATGEDLEYTLRIVPASNASFRQQSQVSSETFTVRARSTEARTVFVDPIAITSVKVEAVLAGNLVSTIELGNTPSFSDPENCVDGIRPSDGTPCDVDENELHDLELQQLSPEAAALLNAALLNAALLNVGVQASDLVAGEVNAALLNAALLNADLLNANLLNPTLVALAQEGAAAEPNCTIDYPSLCDPDDVPISADVINFAVADDGQTINAALLNAALLNAALLNANLLNANLLNANLLNANLLNANLLNANLLNANLLNANLLNADLLNANLLNANLLNANLLNATIAADPTATVTYDDYTYPVTNNGNVTTAINADIQINAPDAVDPEGNPILENGQPLQNVLGTKLIAWTANATPTRIDCEDRVQLDSRVQSIAPNPDNDLKIAEIESPFDGEVTAIAAPGETVFFTLRVVGTPAQLRNVRVSGFTASSQASNCRVDNTQPDGYFCEDNLRDDNERILFQDTVPPVLTVNGDNPTTVEAGVETYVELGATAIDNIDGDISSSVDITPGGPPVDSNVIGEYFVIYQVSDSAGNPADTQTRIVNVVDTTVPVITLNGAATVTLEAGIETYVEQGATATDNADPSVSVLTGGDAVDDTTVGTYVVTYDATDIYGNAAAQVTRTVNVVDTTVPVITLNGAATVTLEAGIETYVEQGATATDNADPAVSVMTGGDAVDDTAVGTYMVTYNAMDASGNSAAQVTRTVNVVDTTIPVITLVGAATVTLEAGIGGYAEQGATVADNADSTITVSIGGNAVNASAVGIYVVTYDAADASGNAAVQVTRTINVVDNTAPVIVLAGDANITLEADLDTYAELGATVIDAGNPLAPLLIGGDTVDTNAVGTYVVTYNANDGFNVAAQVIRTVTVVDTTAPEFDPVIPPTGFDPDAPYPFQLGATANSIFVTWPVTATDADPNLAISCSVDGNPLPLQGTVAMNGDTITATFAYDFPVGFTEVSCTATDANGLSTLLNPPFTVEVLDVTAPVIAVPSDPVFVGASTSPAVVDYADQVSVFDAVYPDTEAVCEPASGSEFNFGDTTVTCNAVDASGNPANEVSFTITVGFPYDIYLQPPKKNPRAGSTVPLDWQYFDRDTGQAVDSSAIMVGVAWEKATNSSCLTLTPAPTDGSSFLVDADSGNSDFRYSGSSDTWQFSWQTPDNARGWHKVTIEPPGGYVDGAWDCVRLR